MAVAGGFLHADFLALLPELFADNTELSVDALRKFSRLCFAALLSTEDYYEFLGYNCLVPPRIRGSLLMREIDNDPVVHGLRKPALVSYGERDRVVTPAMVQHIAALAGHSASRPRCGSQHSLCRCGALQAAEIVLAITARRRRR